MYIQTCYAAPKSNICPSTNGRRSSTTKRCTSLVPAVKRNWQQWRTQRTTMVTMTIAATTWSSITITWRTATKSWAPWAKAHSVKFSNVAITRQANLWPSRSFVIRSGFTIRLWLKSRSWKIYLNGYVIAHVGAKDMEIICSTGPGGQASGDSND
jgi:hypothetical protein